jgi:hypothetical protein
MESWSYLMSATTITFYGQNEQKDVYFRLWREPGEGHEARGYGNVRRKG